MFSGKPVSSAGWDFGSQAQSTRKYKMLCWIESEYWGLQKSPVFRLKEPKVNNFLVMKENAAFSRLLPQYTSTEKRAEET